MTLAHQNIEKVRSALYSIRSSLKILNVFRSVCENINLDVETPAINVEKKCYSTCNKHSKAQKAICSIIATQQSI